MKSLLFTITLILVAGCTDTPLIKTSDPAMAEEHARRASNQRNKDNKPIDPIALRERTIKCDTTKRSLTSCYDEADFVCSNERLFVSSIEKVIEATATSVPSIVFKCNAAITYEREDFLARERERDSPTKRRKRSLMEELLGVPNPQ